ncbi:hypothetical protein V6N13_065725 [Hibiscus sabdariffa]|uniref:Uncharacterized protein n=1 Tax=Hibiscus sabdariffa TaxID=183260 RepID=A0ABR2QQC1_9ROSI
MLNNNPGCAGAGDIIRHYQGNRGIGYRRLVLLLIQLSRTVDAASHPNTVPFMFCSCKAFFNCKIQHHQGLDLPRREEKR